MLACVIYSAKLTFMEISLATIINMGINDIPISPADPVIKQYSFSLKYISYKAYYSLTSLYIYMIQYHARTVLKIHALILIMWRRI